MRQAFASPSFYLRVVLIVFLGGVLISSFAFDLSRVFLKDDSIAFLEPGSYRIEGIVVDVESSDSFQKLTLHELELNETTFDNRVLVFVPIYPKFGHNDQIAIRCDLENPEPFDGFRYDRYLASKDIYKTCFSYTSPILLEDGKTPLLQHVRALILDRIDCVLGEPQASLAAGLLLGEQNFSKEWEERFVETGTSHIVAASGYNISVVVLVLSGILVRAGVRRQRAFWFLVQAILGYVILAGAEAAVIRAGVMACLLLVAKQIGRRANLTNAILLTAAIMLAVNPQLLRDDVGFQLSFASTVALIYLAPILEKRLKFIPETFGIRTSMTATVAATIFTLPIIIFSFHRVSLIAVVSNLFILPLVPYAMFFGAIALIGSAAAGPAWLVLSIILTTIRSLASLPFASISL